jgi:hypothetical protein
MLSTHDRKRGLAPVGARVVHPAGCVHLGAPKVGMKPLAADLVFGVKKQDKVPSPLAPEAPGPDEQALLAAADLVPSGDLSSGFSFKPKARPDIGKSTVQACPQAALNAFPAEEAGQNVPDGRLPVEGLYRWKRSGSYKLTQMPDRPLPYAGFEKRLVRKVTKVAADCTQFTNETVAPDFNGNTVVQQWRVKTNASGTVQPTALSVNGPNNGDPERGLALEGITVFDQKGNQLGTSYSFPTGVLYMPLPIRPGTQWQAAAVDPKTGETLSISAQATDHERVDACGEIVDGWRINSTLTFSGKDNVSQTFNYIVAPQLGALVIDEKIQETTSTATYDIESNLGQTKPDPLPAGSQ